VPEWNDRAPLETGLPPLPGAQIGIVLPARLPGDDVKDDRTTRR
jgi:hypothetical protein